MSVSEPCGELGNLGLEELLHLQAYWKRVQIYIRYFRVQMLESLLSEAGQLPHGLLYAVPAQKTSR